MGQTSAPTRFGGELIFSLSAGSAAVRSGRLVCEGRRLASAVSCFCNLCLGSAAVRGGRLVRALACQTMVGVEAIFSHCWISSGVGWTVRLRLVSQDKSNAKDLRSSDDEASKSADIPTVVEQASDARPHSDAAGVITWPPWHRSCRKRGGKSRQRCLLSLSPRSPH